MVWFMHFIGVVHTYRGASQLCSVPERVRKSAESVHSYTYASAAPGSGKPQPLDVC